MWLCISSSRHMDRNREAKTLLNGYAKRWDTCLAVQGPVWGETG
jgi:hypothetical protein